MASKEIKEMIHGAWFDFKTVTKEEVKSLTEGKYLIEKVPCGPDDDDMCFFYSESGEAPERPFDYEDVTAILYFNDGSGEIRYCNPLPIV